MTDSTALRDSARCPRCGAAFHCGVGETSCACAQIPLAEPTRSALRTAFEGCLCLRCLREVQAGHGMVKGAAPAGP